MPREFRKRGKKTKNTTDKKPKDDLIPHEDHHEEQRAGPSWIIPASNDSGEVNLDAPFGYLDADVKAYFRTVDVQIRNWQESDVDAGEANEDADPNEGTLDDWSILITLKRLPILFRKAAFLHRCPEGDVRQGEATCDRPRLFKHTGTNDMLDGRFCTQSLC